MVALISVFFNLTWRLISNFISNILERCRVAVSSLLHIIYLCNRITHAQFVNCVKCVRAAALTHFLIRNNIRKCVCDDDCKGQPIVVASHFRNEYVMWFELQCVWIFICTHMRHMEVTAQRKSIIIIIMIMEYILEFLLPCVE